MSAPVTEKAKEPEGETKVQMKLTLRFIEHNVKRSVTGRAMVSVIKLKRVREQD